MDIKDYIIESTVNEGVESDIKKIGDQVDSTLDVVVNALEEDEDLKSANEKLKKEASKYWVEEPYKFDIYWVGKKNVDFKISIASIENISRNLSREWDELTKGGGVMLHQLRHISSGGFYIEVNPNDFIYKNNPKKTHDLTVLTHRWCYTNKGYAYPMSRAEMIKQTVDTLYSLKEYFVSGKLPCIAKIVDGDKLFIEIDSAKYKKDKEKKIAEMENPDNLQKFEKEYNSETLKKWESPTEKTDKELNNKSYWFRSRKSLIDEFKRLRAKGYTPQEIKDMWHTESVTRICGYGSGGWTGD